MVGVAARSVPGVVAPVEADSRFSGVSDGAGVLVLEEFDAACRAVPAPAVAGVPVCSSPVVANGPERSPLGVEVAPPPAPEVVAAGSTGPLAPSVGVGKGFVAVLSEPSSGVAEAGLLSFPPAPGDAAAFEEFELSARLPIPGRALIPAAPPMLAAALAAAELALPPLAPPPVAPLALPPAAPTPLTSARAEAVGRLADDSPPATPEVPEALSDRVFRVCEVAPSGCRRNAVGSSSAVRSCARRAAVAPAVADEPESFAPPSAARLPFALLAAAFTGASAPESPVPVGVVDVPAVEVADDFAPSLARADSPDPVEEFFPASVPADAALAALPPPDVADAADDGSAEVSSRAFSAPALPRAAFFSSFGSDTYYPSARANQLNSTASLMAGTDRGPQ